MKQSVSRANKITRECTNNATVRDYCSLLKPRVMSLVIFTGFIGLLIAPGNIHPVIGFVAILCIAIGSGAAGAINMWYDRDIDSLMERTKNRPLPKGSIYHQEALHFGVALSCASILLMGLFVNLIATFLLALAILFYVLVYTVWLKRSTSQSIVIGGVAGALPPVIGWAAVTGGVSLESFLLFLIIFMWTPPHFWALSLYKRTDYEKTRLPMMPIIKGVKYTKLQIVLYSVILFLVTLIPSYIGMFGMVYLYTAALLGAIFLYLSIVLYNEKGHKTAPKLFGYSILYLFLLYTVMPIDKILIH